MQEHYGQHFLAANDKGVPAVLAGAGYDNDYWASVALLHFMRARDEKLPIDKLMEKFPYQKSRNTVRDGWE